MIESNAFIKAKKRVYKKPRRFHVDRVFTDKKARFGALIINYSIRCDYVCSKSSTVTELSILILLRQFFKITASLGSLLCVRTLVLSRLE